jgi:REP element-mobilizing transposase RayT
LVIAAHCFPFATFLAMCRRGVRFDRYGREMGRFGQRRNRRLPGRDYAAGAYFVTVCAQQRGGVFGENVAGEVRLNDIGNIVAEAWRWLPCRYPNVTLGEWCVMPDHLHGIVILTAPTTVDPQGTTADHQRCRPLGRLIGAFKTVSTKNVNLLRGTPGAILWQRDFWDRVVRDDVEMIRIRRYIRENPMASPVGAVREPP